MLYLKLKIENRDREKTFSPGDFDPGKCQVPGILRHLLSDAGRLGTAPSVNAMLY